MFKVGKNQFYWAFCQDISVNFIFTLVFKVDTIRASKSAINGARILKTGYEFSKGGYLRFFFW
jgi:hypothetical protein